jgi:HD-GYP domain-containing protein (c-di-GMP phosphodiesterase class II)
MSHAKTSKLPSIASKLRKNERFAVIVIVTLSAFTASLLLIDFIGAARYVQSREAIRRVNQAVVAVLSMPASSDGYAIAALYASERDAIGSVANLPPMTPSEASVDLARSNFRNAAQRLNDGLGSIMSESLLFGAIILLGAAALLLAFLIASRRVERAHSAFVARAASRLEALAGLVRSGVARDRGGAVPVGGGATSVRWQEDEAFEAATGRIAAEIELNGRLLDFGYESSNLDEMLERIAGIASTLLPCDRIAVALIDTLDNVVAEAAYGMAGPIELEEGFALPLAETSLGGLARLGAPRIINDLGAYLGSAQSRPTALIVKEGYRSSLTIPIVIQGVCRGFAFFNSVRAGAYDQGHVRQAERIVGIIRHYVYHHYVVQIMLAESSAAFVKAMEKKDNETGLHIVRMSRYSHAIAHEMHKSGAYPAELGHRMLREILWFAPLHDIGKIGIPDAVLFKPGRLDADEIQVMRGHVLGGSAILRDMAGSLSQYLHGRLLATAIDIIEGHHERWDGGGYPRGLSGLGIPLAARIVAVGDVFDALTSARPYKEAWSFERAADHIASDSGMAFDPLVVDGFLRCMPALEEIGERYREAA